MMASTGEQTIIVGVYGLAGVGKSSIVDELVRRHPETYVQCAFAASLKRGVEGLLGLPAGAAELDETKATKVPELGMTVGRLLQEFGSSLRAGLRSDVFPLLLQRRLVPGKVNIVTDVRTVDDMEWVRRQPANLLVKIERPWEEHCDVYARTGRNPAHGSETDQLRFVPDAVVHNSSARPLLAAVEQLRHAIDDYFVARAP